MKFTEKDGNVWYWLDNPVPLTTKNEHYPCVCGLTVHGAVGEYNMLLANKEELTEKENLIVASGIVYNRYVEGVQYEDNDDSVCLPYYQFDILAIKVEEGTELWEQYQAITNFAKYKEALELAYRLLNNRNYSHAKEAILEAVQNKADNV